MRTTTSFRKRSGRIVSQVRVRDKIQMQAVAVSMLMGAMEAFAPNHPKPAAMAIIVRVTIMLFARCFSEPRILVAARPERIVVTIMCAIKDAARTPTMPPVWASKMAMGMNIIPSRSKIWRTGCQSLIKPKSPIKHPLRFLRTMSKARIRSPVQGQ